MSNDLISLKNTRTSKFSILLPFLVLIVGFIMTLTAWISLKNNEAKYELNRFQIESEKIAGDVSEHINRFTEVVVAAKGLFAASKSVERDEFHEYYKNTLFSHQYKGNYYFMFVENVQQESLPTFIESVKSDASITPGGYPDFHIFPENETSQTMIVKYMEPIKGNEKILGYNMYSEPTRRKMLMRAWASGKPALSGLVTVVGDPKRRTAFLICAPLYKNGMPVSTVAQRKKALFGYVVGSFIADDVFSHIVTGSAAGRFFDFEIFDDTLTTSGSSEKPVIFDADYCSLGSDFKSRNDLYFFKKDIRILGRKWIIYTRAFHGFLQTIRGHLLVTVVLWAGILLSLLASGIFFALNRSRNLAVTVAREMTKDLSESQQRLRAIVETAQDAIITADKKGMIVSWNKGAQILFGYSKEEIIEKPLVLIIPERYRQAHEKGFNSYLETGVPKVIGRVVELAGIRKGGVEFPLELSLSSSKVNADIFFTAILRDITERKKNEKLLRENEERFQAIFDGSSDALMLLTEKGFFDCNPKTLDLFGFKTKEDFIKVHPAEVSPLLQADGTESMAAAMKHIQTAFDTGKDQFEWTHRRFDGEDFPAEVTLSRFMYNGKLVLQATVRDLSEKKKLEGRLAQSQKMEMIGTLTGGIAHNLNNQLTPVLGYLDIFIRENKDQKDISMLSEAKQAALRCVEIIQKIKNISRPSLEIKTIIQISSVLEETKELFTAVFPSSIGMEITYDKALWPIFGNENEIETVLMNLATNARDAMKNNSGKFIVHTHNVELSSEKVKQGFKPGSYVYIEVRDTGTGISEKDKPRLFQPFFTTKKHEGGTGLGLAMVLNVVTNHGGWIDVSSEEGKGTIFFIYFPAKPGAEVKIESYGEPTRVPAGSGTILFVDDEEYMRNIGKAFLERLGYKVLLANDGKEAIAVFRENQKKIRGVVLDMVMPNVTGGRALQEILKIDPKARVLITSGHTEEGTREELINRGAANFLIKPYTIAPFAQALKKMLGGK